MSFIVSTNICCSVGGINYQSYANVQEFVSDGTWVRPSGVNRVRIIAIGGGGGGGTCHHVIGTSETNYNYFASGGGGGAGQFIDKTFYVNDDIDIVIGQGGLGGNQSQSISVSEYGEKGGDTILSNGINLTLYGGGGGAAYQENPTYSYENLPYRFENIGCSGGGAIRKYDPGSSLYGIRVNGGPGGGIGEIVPEKEMYGIFADQLDANYSYSFYEPYIPYHPKKIYGNLGSAYPLSRGAHGIYGIGGGGAGSGGYTENTSSGDYVSTTNGLDGGGRGGIIEYNVPGSDYYIKELASGGDATSNSGAGGGAGGFIYDNTVDGNFRGSGGKGGSGLAIIMW